MNAEDVAQELFKLAFKAAMSQEYFQIMEWRWEWGDITAKFAVAVLAILGIYAAAGKPKRIGKQGFNVAVGSVFLLIVILILPSDKWAQEYRDLAQQWGTIRQQADNLEREAEKTGPTEKIFADAKELRGHIGLIREPAPWRTLLENCYWDQIERIYGDGIRSKEELEKHLSKAAIGEPRPPEFAPPVNDQASR